MSASLSLVPPVSSSAAPVSPRSYARLPVVAGSLLTTHADLRMTRVFEW
jgi:hypothetical protein